MIDITGNTYHELSAIDEYCIHKHTKLILVLDYKRKLLISIDVPINRLSSNSNYSENSDYVFYNSGMD